MARWLDRGLDRPQRDSPTQNGEKLRYREKGAGRGPLRDEPERFQEVDGEAVLLQGPLMHRGRPHLYPTFGRSAGLSRTLTHALAAAPPGPRLLRPRVPPPPRVRDPPSRPASRTDRRSPGSPCRRRSRHHRAEPGQAGGRTAETTPTRDHARGSRAPKRPRPARRGSVPS